MIGRSEFLRGMVASAALGTAGCLSSGAKKVGVVPTRDVKIRSALLHLGMNMWGSYRAPGEREDQKCRYTRTVCPTDPAVWNDITALMQKRHYNQAIIDLGGGVAFPSHPEITVKGSRSAQWVHDEVRRLADMGIEAVPKLNFSTCHDAWLGIYERMVSSPKYYEVVRNLIDDAAEMFGNPRFIHLGLDEENDENQRKHAVMTIRRGDLWWHDLKFYLDCLERHNARAIIFGGTVAAKDEKAFFARMPKSVVLNVGMYGHTLTKEMCEKHARLNPKNEWWDRMNKIMHGLIRRMGESGYDILSCSSNWVDISNKKKYPVIKYGKDFPQDRESIAWLHNFLAKEVPAEHLIGGMTAPWEAMEPKFLPYWRDGIDQLADAMDAHGWKS